MASVQFFALALIGELVTSPWLKTFYRNAESQHSYAAAISIVKGVLAELKGLSDPLDLLHRSTDLFGGPLPAGGSRFRQHSAQHDQGKLREWVGILLSACSEVIERQYGDLLVADVEQHFVSETRSARTHNIIAEEIVGMYSAAKERSPHATTDLHSCRIRYVVYLLCLRQTSYHTYIFLFLQEYQESHD